MQLTATDKSRLMKYVGEAGASLVSSLIEEHGIRFIIKRNRITKSGDYCHPHPRRPIHQITINGTLNRYAFLITFIHEVAHLRAWNRFKGKVSPHGIEWKSEYHQLLKEVNCSFYFPEDIQKALTYHMGHIKSSSAYDIQLMKALQKYDEHMDSLITVGDLPVAEPFRYKGREFIRGEQLRTRIKCRCVTDKREYLFHQLAPVELLAI